MTLDVYADLACPWCSIGEAHLARALAARPDLAVERRWRPFQLQPGLPRAGVPLRPFFPDKFGGEDAMQAAFARTAEAGRAAGLPFDFSRLAGAPNTADAHRLVLLAGAHGRTWEAARALFDGYFAHGRDLSDADTLVERVAGAGVPADEARDVLASDRFADDVAAAQAEASALGIGGVPFVVVAGRYGVSGAQPPEVWADVLDRVAAETASEDAP